MNLVAWVCISAEAGAIGLVWLDSYYGWFWNWLQRREDRKRK